MYFQFCRFWNVLEENLRCQQENYRLNDTVDVIKDDIAVLAVEVNANTRHMEENRVVIDKLLTVNDIY